VQADVGIGMAGEAAIMRNANAADGDMVAGTEGVHVDAGTGAHIAQRAEGDHFGPSEIGFIGDLDVARLAGKRAHFQAGPFGQRGIVGEVGAALRLCSAVRVEQRREDEGLRRLHQPQRVAVDRFADQAFGVDGLDGIGDGKGGDRRAALFRGGNRA
jgi:hypothetical protein